MLYNVQFRKGPWDEWCVANSVPMSLNGAKKLRADILIYNSEARVVPAEQEKQHVGEK